VLAIATCSALAFFALAAPVGARTVRPAAPLRAARAVGLGKILTTADGGQIFGFDINQAGDDGVLASSQTIKPNGELLVSVETFDQDTGRILKSFAKYRGKQNSYGVDGIFAGDVGLVTHYFEPKNSIYSIRYYDVMNPVSGGKFTGRWTPPIKDVDVQLIAENQTTTTSVLYAIELKNNDVPDLFVSNIAANTFGPVIHLDPDLFSLEYDPQLGQYTAANQAVLALSPDAGEVGGSAPLNVLVDLSSGKTIMFNGFNGGPYGAGAVNGLAVDPNTGVAATTTELNAQVEFYDLAKRAGIEAVQLPCTGPSSQLSSGAGITVDPLNKLFLVTEQLYCNGNQGSALIVYNERGHLIETITGFSFVGAEPPVAINPSKRMGWAWGPGFSHLQQFFY
jgi:hypothetical protein